jgi:hypothetical protein
MAVGVGVGFVLGALAVAVRCVRAAELHPDDVPGGDRAQY